ncbi:hypothetical protein ACFQGT_06545 [Natrialbaceae archaeon GCM10025810]
MGEGDESSEFASGDGPPREATQSEVEEAIEELEDEDRVVVGS